MPIPRPPYLPDTIEDLQGDQFRNCLGQWFNYIQESCRYLEEADTAIANAKEDTNQATLKVDALKQQITFLIDEKREEQRQAEVQLQRHLAVIEYQKGELREKEERCMKAEMEKEKALALAAPTVPNPKSPHGPALPTESPADPTPRTSPPVIATPPTSTRASERLPDPEKFNGERKDLRRFVSQIKEKLTVNLDRFPTPQSRCAYVTSRLAGQPYSQILPYIQDGVCQLPDYHNILDILERAFGDPNRINNARNELYRLRQTNREFSTFFAEFQRLALEGEMPEESLPTMLEQAINRELRAMLLHHDPPSRQYLPFAQFLQSLENRRRLYENPPALTPRTYAQTMKERAPASAAPGAYPARREETAIPPPPRGDPMDLSAQRTPPVNGRKERRECFRCGSPNHRVRDCPHPDHRQTLQARSSTWTRLRTSTPPRGRRTTPPHSPPVRSYASPTGSSNPSVNGVSLN